MKTRKILSALLAVLVCATMAVSFTSCGDDETKPDDTSDTAGENTDDTADTDAPADDADTDEGETEPEAQG